MLKKCAAIFMALVIAAFSMAACSETGTENSNSSSTSSSASSSSYEKDSSSDNDASDNGDTSESNDSSDTSSSDENSSTADMFADGDYKDVTSEEANATITLSGSTGTISDTSRGSSGSEVTITSKGIYRVTGSSEDVSIVINDSTKSGNIYLILDNVSMTNSSTACINVESCDKLIIQCVGENTLTYTNTSSDEKIDGAIYAKDDVTINGSGKLNITSSLHGIVCKEDLKITDSELTINAESIGIQAKDSVRIGGGKISVTAGHDGIQVENKTSDSYFYFEEAELTVNAGYDGIAVTSESDSDSFTGYVFLNSGIVNVTAGGGSDNSKDSSTSQKGIKCGGDITIAGTNVTISSADDSVHSNGNIVVNSGTVEVSSSDDGMSADGDLTINGGTVNVTKSYEGLEAKNVTINDGDVSVVSSDDGINCAGGSDTSSDEVGPWGSASTDATLTINGGNVYVNASGDGLDSNGSIYITGGMIIVEGPTDNGNGALDKGDSSDCVASITGGTVLAIGTTGMAVNFDTGTQCSALVTLSGSSGTEISVDDGSGFTYTATKAFGCAVYSSPSLSQGNSYTITAGSSSASMDFSSSLYYTDVAGGMGGMGGRGGMDRR